VPERQRTKLKPRGRAFAPGNTLSLVHGATSPPVVVGEALAVMAGIVRDEVIEQAPWILEPIFADALAAYCRAEAVSRILSRHIFDVTADPDRGPGDIPVRLWESHTATTNAAAKLRAELGLTAMSRARLATLTTSSELNQAGLDQLRDKGRAIRQRRQAALGADVTSACQVDDGAPDATGECD
jgi:hypothetical protein